MHIVWFFLIKLLFLTILKEIEIFSIISNEFCWCFSEQFRMLFQTIYRMSVHSPKEIKIDLIKLSAFLSVKLSIYLQMSKINSYKPHNFIRISNVFQICISQNVCTYKVPLEIHYNFRHFSAPTNIRFVCTISNLQIVLNLSERN